MKNLIVPIVLILTLVFPAYADDLQDGEDAYFKGDYKTAFEKFKLLAEQGDAKSQSNLGEMYLYGRGTTKDYQETVKWFNLAAEQEYAEAQHKIGGMYLTGRGTTQDDKEAVKWFNLAAEQEHASAQYKLGEMYFTGQGAAQDYLQAHMWFNLAYANGRNAGRTYRKLIEEQITADQIEEAWKLVREWKAKRK